MLQLQSANLDMTMSVLSKEAATKPTSDPRAVPSKSDPDPFQMEELVEPNFFQWKDYTQLCKPIFQCLLDDAKENRLHYLKQMTRVEHGAVSINRGFIHMVWCQCWKMQV